MSFQRFGEQLFNGVMDGNVDAVKAALEAGASVNGWTEHPLPPIAAAAIVHHADVVELLLDEGADPDSPVVQEMSCTEYHTATAATTNPGERALAISARSGNEEIVRLLLKRAGADPNATDNTGRTPLMATCLALHVRLEVVRLLLEAGADPALAEENGWIPLHAAAANRHTDVVDMLYSRAPSTLNRCDALGQTPLYLACSSGHEGSVSNLLSLGAMERTPLDESSRFPLTLAVAEGFVGVVRVLINERGIRAVGGDGALAQALYMAVRFPQARILRLLLTAGVGGSRRSEWANFKFDGRHLLHYGAGYCYPDVMSVLLEAGADEAVRDLQGFIPRAVIGVDLARDGEPQMDRWKEVAIRRMLQRGPAYRARSWAWPSEEEADAGGRSDGDTAAAAAAAAVVPSSPPAMKTPPVIGVRIFRPTEKSRSKFFVRLIGRYCAKD